MPPLDHEARSRMANARVARLATVRPDGGPHVVPITFDLDTASGQLVTAVDQKPKSTTRLQRLVNIEANPDVSVLVDHYEDAWSRLWWVRADGVARLLDERARREQALDRLAAKYPQYREDRPAGVVIAVSIERFSSWSAT